METGSSKKVMQGTKSHCGLVGKGRRIKDTAKAAGSGGLSSCTQALTWGTGGKLNYMQSIEPSANANL